jgi:hypothetical protein
MAFFFPLVRIVGKAEMSTRCNFMYTENEERKKERERLYESKQADTTAAIQLRHYTIRVETDGELRWSNNSRNTSEKPGNNFPPLKRLNSNNTKVELCSFFCVCFLLFFCFFFHNKRQLCRHRT